jgi:Tfp pilus assembly protein PilX
VPRRFPPGSAECRRNGGFALIIVLWTLVLIGFIVAHLTASGRTEIRIAGNLVANSASQAAADGAIFEAIFNLSAVAGSSCGSRTRHLGSTRARLHPSSSKPCYG